MKKCKKCGETKPIAEFSKDAKARDGMQSSCKACAAAYYVANREKLRSANAKWQAENPKKRGVSIAKYRAANSVKLKSAAAKWWEANADKRRIYEHNRRASKREVGGKLSKGLSERLFKLQRGKCACCGLPLGDDYHLDHIMPLALGGVNADTNMQLLRQSCNNQKYAKHPVDFMQSRGFLL